MESETVKPRKTKQSNVFNKIIYASQGISWALLNDVSVRAAYIISIPISFVLFIFTPNIDSKILSIVIFSLWIIFETLNTCIEATIDRIGTEYHLLSKAAKDTSASVVSIVVCVLIISIILLCIQIKYAYDEWLLKRQENKQTDDIWEYIKWTFKK
jgi:diacylglycerol kinase (ATP)